MKTRSLVFHPVLVALAVFAVLTLASYPLGVPLTRITQIVIYTLYGMGVALLVSYTGLVPFGASVFFGCAGYAVALAMQHVGGNELTGLAIAVVFSLAIGFLIGKLVLRRSGLYFSLLTLACSQIAYEVAFNWTSVTGGENGLQGVPRPLFGSPLAFHLFVVATVALGILFLWHLVHAPFGRSLQALRDNEQRAASLGYDVLRLKLSAFVVSAAVVGYAGGLLTLMIRGAYANSLSWQHAADALLMTILGGVNHFLGTLWGAIAFILLQDRLSALTDNWWLIFAPVIILMALLAPEGIQGAFRKLVGRTGWTLVRDTIPARPAVIAPFESAAAAVDPTKPVLAVRGISKRFGSIVTARGIDLAVMPARVHSFIGPNGAGKTTFFNMLSGLIEPDEGEILFEGRNINRLPIHARARLGIARSFQILSVFNHLTVFENVRVAVQARSPKRNGFWKDAHAIGEINAEAWSLLAVVGLENRAAEKCANLSHGEQRLLEIAITLAADAKILLLDEPLAGLAEADRQVVAALIQRLGKTHAVLLIEHDIDRVLAISDRLTVLHQGRLIADGAPREVAREPAVIEAYMGDAPTGDAVIPPAPDPRTPPRKPLLVVENLCAGYDGSRILDNLGFELREGEAVALLGRNGVGKSTTLRALMSAVDIASGRITLAGQDITALPSHEINRLGISMVPEGRRLFHGLTVAENLILAQRPGGITVEEVHELFPKLKILWRQKAAGLSGGERQMVAVARALMVPSKVILLDEPFEGLAPAVVQDIMDAVVKLRGRASLLIVEHHAESVLPIVDRAYIMVNGQIAYEGSAHALALDHATQARLLGVAGEAEPEPELELAK
jgi:ABC-type branched-subunit amino acid transport system ATPase component/ABC-type branched-subunit amino acid transport system permease subunit